ncbi:hypothetical protein GCM10011375_06270 [Hymenobacter qilianensis]|uniref:Uncharacterized protein n=2 Tax=Hymenobacter qilianensis TaxID=1385715 RepID=A0ACB5PMK9_9BACT|nr:hypothetical protein [Hymenobacter qilianensis]QNP53729.1 hypothetical protein H9L05_09405 [Hymenobacter qilianensis]GGF53498.1 hypothetical protein GCM10011375_06270 [Hymenobacter qilianensis]
MYKIKNKSIFFLKSRFKSIAKRKKSHNERLIKWKINQGVKRALYQKLREPEDHPAPKIFSLIQNPEGVLKYFREIGDVLSRRKSILLNLEDIEVLTSDAIAFLIAIIKDRRFNRGVKIEGLPPRNLKLFKMLASSGFYKFVKSKMSALEKSDHILLHTVTRNKVENRLAKQAAAQAVYHTFGDKRKFRPVYEILIECMANTNNHADTIYQGRYDWWLFVYNDEESKVSKFTFLDLGVGVFNSIPVKKFKDLVTLKDLAAKLGLLQNIYLVDDLFNGRISSRTGLGERGQGFPLIYEHSKNDLLQNFYLVSNDVYTNLKTGDKKDLENLLPGTLLTWELHPEKYIENETN